MKDPERFSVGTGTLKLFGVGDGIGKLLLQEFERNRFFFKRIQKIIMYSELGCPYQRADMAGERNLMVPLDLT